MSKALEALKRIEHDMEYVTRLDFVEPIVRGEVQQELCKIYHREEKDLTVIEKELKAFEIIKKKNVNVLMVKEAESYDKYLSAPAPLNVVDCYGVYHKDQVLTKEEFDSIREGLK